VCLCCAEWIEKATSLIKPVCCSGRRCTSTMDSAIRPRFCCLSST
jgi:hypothetical protein